MDERRSGRNTARSPTNAADPFAGSSWPKGWEPSGGGKSRSRGDVEAGRESGRAADDKVARTNILKKTHTQLKNATPTQAAPEVVASVRNSNFVC